MLFKFTNAPHGFFLPNGTKSRKTSLIPKKTTYRGVAMTPQTSKMESFTTIVNG